MVVTELPQPVVLGCTDSTNRLLASQYHQGTAAPFSTVVARHQSAGRGRLDHTWFAPADTSLLFSTIAAVPESADVLGWVPLAAALAVKDLIDAELSSLVGAVTWPNDVLIDQQKVAGILTEHLSQDGSEHLVTVGVGINLTDCPPGATSLRAHGWDKEPSEATLVELATALRKRLIDRLSHMNQIPGQYRRACTTVGRQVTATLPDGTEISGLAGGIDDGGGLQIADITVTAAQVTLNGHRPPLHSNYRTTCEECQ